MYTGPVRAYVGSCMRAHVGAYIRNELMNTDVYT